MSISPWVRSLLWLHMHLSSNTVLFISTPIWVFVLVFFFSCNFCSEMNSPYCSFWRGDLKPVTEEKEDEEPGNSLDHFLQKCVSRQAEPNRGRVTLSSTFY